MNPVTTMSQILKVGEFLLSGMSALRLLVPEFLDVILFDLELLKKITPHTESCMVSNDH